MSASPLENGITDIPSPGRHGACSSGRHRGAHTYAGGDAARLGVRDIRNGYPAVQERRCGRLLK
jgi:hypothetical protein